MKRYIRSNRQYIRSAHGDKVTGIFYKNVDICDLPSILSKGILSLNASGNDNWGDGHRVNNSRDVVYLFRPTGYENSFVNYGAALLEVEVDGIENGMLEQDINRGKYIEYICDCVPPENILAVYIPEIFKDKVSYRHPKIKWCGMEAKVFSSELWGKNAEMYGEKTKYGYTLPLDFDESKHYVDVDDDMLQQFADTVSNIDDSSAWMYFRGLWPNRDVFDLKYIHYDI